METPAQQLVEDMRVVLQHNLDATLKECIAALRSAAKAERDAAIAKVRSRFRPQKPSAST